MKRSTAAIVVLAAGVSLGAATGIGLALFSDDDGIPLQLQGGYVHYAVGDPTSLDGRSTGGPVFTGKDGAPGWRLPEHMLRDLKPGDPQTAVVQIDGFSQGNRGLEYWFAGLEIEGDSGLFDAADLDIVPVDDPEQCVAGQLGDFEPRYTGPSADARFDDYEMVFPRQFNEVDGYGTWENDSLTHYLCLELALPAEPPTYTNTVTATGTGQDGASSATVTDSDRWSAVLDPTEAQRTAEVTLTFPYATYRPGGADGAGSSGSTP